MKKLGKLLKALSVIIMAVCVIAITSISSSAVYYDFVSGEIHYFTSNDGIISDDYAVVTCTELGGEFEDTDLVVKTFCYGIDWYGYVSYVSAGFSYYNPEDGISQFFSDSSAIFEGNNGYAVVYGCNHVNNEYGMTSFGTTHTSRYCIYLDRTYPVPIYCSPTSTIYEGYGEWY
ncbi:MAG: hypothetical protein K5647_08065 [Clostridiales bacterium]|nr:hypothetical protein [Clostridiales bacterium]